MGFAYASGVITQSGTDTSLAGLAGLTGVTVTTIAVASGTFQGVKQYTINSATKLQVDGILSHDPDSEILVLQRNDTDRPLTISGTYNYGSSASFRGGTVYQAGCGLVIAGYYTGTQRQFRDTEAGIYVSGTGTLNWKGATIFSGRSIISDGAMNIENGKFVPRCTNTATKDYCPRIGFKSGTGRLNGLQVEGGAGHFFGVTLGAATLSQFQGLDAVGNNDFAAVIAPEPGDATGFESQFLLVSDIQDLSFGNLNVSRAWQGRFIEFLNYAGGVSLKDQLSDKTSTEINARGAVLATKQVSASFATSDGTPIQGAKFYVTEASDGNEPPASVNTAFTAGDISYLESPQSFLLTADVSGETTTATLAIYFGYKMTATNPMVDNVRTLNGGNTVQAGWYSYLHQIGTKEVLVSGQNEATEAITLVRDLSVTEANEATALAYTTQETTAKAYDHLKAILGSVYAGQDDTYASRVGTELNAGSYNVVINGTGSGAATIVGNTITLNASTYTGDMVTTGIITLTNGATFVGTRTDANGTIAPPKVVSITNIIAGSRIQIYNVTTATEIVNEIVSGTSYSSTYTEGASYSNGDVIRVRIGYSNGTNAKMPFSSQVVAGSNGWSLLVNQVDDDVYNTIGIDGSFVTEFSEDFPNIQVDINDPDGTTQVDRLYAWFVYVQSNTADGLRLWFEGIVPEDIANFRIVTSKLNLKIDNISSNGVTFSDGRRLYRDDNASPLVNSTTGGGSITFFAGKVYTSVVSTSSPVITGDISDVPAAVQTGMTSQGYTTARATKIDDILVDTNDLQTNQGNWLTATGFSTHSVSDVVTALQLVADDFKASPTDLTGVLNAIDALNDLSLAQVEGSSVLAKENTLSILATAIAAIPTTDSVADLTPVLTAIANLNDVSAAEVRAAFDPLEFRDKNTEAEIHAWLDTYHLQENLTVINNGIKKASKIIPHNTDLT